MSKDFSVEKFRGQPCQQVLALRFGRPADIPALDELQRRVLAGMEQPEWYVPSTRQEMASQMEKGIFLCLWAGEEAVAYLSLVCLGRESGNYGWDLELHPDQIPLWANVDSVVVAPEYRGNRIQRRLLRLAEEYRPPRIIGFGCTVSPQNRFSRGALEAEGYRPACQKEKYGGHLRLVMKKELFPLPGLYRHFKGGQYRVIGPVRHSESGETLVLYQALYGEKGYWVRPLPMWNEWVERDGWKGPRFCWQGRE